MINDNAKGRGNEKVRQCKRVVANITQVFLSPNQRSMILAASLKIRS